MHACTSLIMHTPSLSSQSTTFHLTFYSHCAFLRAFRIIITRKLKKKEKKKTTLLFLTYDKTNILMRYAKAVDSFLLINNKQQNKKN